MATDYNALMEFAKTDRQREVLQACIDHPSVRLAAQAAGLSERNAFDMLKRIKKLAVKQNYSPEHNMGPTVPEGMKLRGTSDLYGPDGELKLRWVKTQEDREAMLELMQAVADGMSEEIPKAVPVPAPNITSMNDLLNLFILTDAHIGMRSWPEETGEAWDIDIAEKIITRWFDMAIDMAPPAETAVLCNLGDLIHWDGIFAETPMNKHHLDADTRFQLLPRVTIKIIRYIVRSLLAKHPKVHIIMADANHDPYGEAWLREWAHAHYEDDPRVTVERSAGSYYCYEHGETSLFFHHGHKRRPESVDSVFAGMFRDVFGRTKHSYAHMGHIHSAKSLETNLMIINQHRTLAAKDAFAANSGYLAGRSADCITYHNKHGEVGRITLSVDMIESALGEAA